MHVFCEDVAAGVAYWAASQASRITANSTALIGGLGVDTVRVDSSAAMEKMGLKVHKIASGPHKGAGVPGTPITDAHLAKAKETVDTLGKLFFDDVARGRALSPRQLKNVTDGGLYIASVAKSKGLIDAVDSIDGAYARLATRLGIEVKPIGRGAAPFAV